MNTKITTFCPNGIYRLKKIKPLMSLEDKLNWNNIPGLVQVRRLAGNSLHNKLAHLRAKSSMQKWMIKNPHNIIALGWISDIKLKFDESGDQLCSWNFIETNENSPWSSVSSLMSQIIPANNFWDVISNPESKMFRHTKNLHSMIKN